MTAENIALLAGILLLVIAIVGGQIKHRDTYVPKLGRQTRVILGMFGVGLILPWTLSFLPNRSDVPTGAFLPYWSGDVPDGWLLCNGEPIPEGNEFRRLRQLVGATTPNLCGLFLRELDPDRKVDTEARSIGHLQGSEVGPHVHRYAITGGKHKHELEFTAAVREHNDGDNTSHPGAHEREFKLETTPEGGADDHVGSVDENSGRETRPSNVAVNFIIKA